MIVLARNNDSSYLQTNFIFINGIWLFLIV